MTVRLGQSPKGVIRVVIPRPGGPGLGKTGTAGFQHRHCKAGGKPRPGLVRAGTGKPCLEEVQASEGREESFFHGPISVMSFPEFYHIRRREFLYHRLRYSFSAGGCGVLPVLSAMGAMYIPRPPGNQSRRFPHPASGEAGWAPLRYGVSTWPPSLPGQRTRSEPVGEVFVSLRQ